MQTLTSRVLEPPPTRVLLDEIKMHRIKLETTLAAVTNLWCQDGSLAMSVKEELEMNLRRGIEEIHDFKRTLTTTAGNVATCRIIGAYRPSKIPIVNEPHILTSATDEDFIRRLEEGNLLLQRSLFQVLVQNSLGYSTRSSSNFWLQSLKNDVMQTMGNDMSPADKEFLRIFPADIRTARKLLGGPKTITYACCPACNSLYPPQHEDGVLVYPYVCTSEPCQLRGGCKLLKVGSTPDGKGKSIGVPQHPFVMQDFHDFVARLLSRPGMEAAIQQSGERMCEEAIEDIITADGVREIKGPDNAPFLSGGQPDELRLLWCLSVDFFNLYHNKIAGKVASVGSIVLSCLLLPPDMQHKPENLCLVGIIPGPREPSGEEIDHFLRPLVEVMKESWAYGAIYGTHDYPHGRLVRSAIAISVNDLPMARKIMGTANYIDRNTAKEDNPDLWRVRTLQKVQEDADKWRSAMSQKERKRLYGKTGVRHSVLMELEYWNPTTMVPVDCMHLFFLGLLQYHARMVLGIDSAGTRNAKDTKTMIGRLEDTRKMLLRTSPQSLDLSTLTVDVLKALCEERGIGVTQSGGAHKEDLIASLKV